MLSARVAGTLAVLALMSACSEGRGEPTDGPRLPAVELEPATVGVAYEARLPATGGLAPLSYSFVGTPPPGFSFYTSEARLTGPGSAAGDYNITVRVRDTQGREDVRTWSLKVLPTDVPPRPAVFPMAVGNWNIEWFGDATYGPADDLQQLVNVQAVIAEADVDFWGLGEIVSTEQFNELKARLPGYDGFLADDRTHVSSGASYYTASEQKLGVLYKSDVVQVVRAEVVLGNRDFDFAGRPPLRVDLRITRGGASVDVTALVVHLKAMAGTEEYERRKAAATWLKDYLDTHLPTQRAMVVGDWNDDVDVATTTDPVTRQKLDTPFRNFVNDTERYTFVTQALSLASEGSTVGRSTFIDHQLVTNELAANYVANSATVLRPAIPSYGSSTSDHYPVLSRYDFGEGGLALRVTAPNGGETLLAGTAYTLTWTATGVDTVRVQYSVDNGATWRDLVASVPAASGSYTWTVPGDASSGARVRVSDTRDANVADVSDSTFTLNHAAQQVFINEYLPQPNNAPGSTSPDYDQMFVELLNTGTTAVDLGGWKVHDDKSYSGVEVTRHIFPAGTVIQPGKTYIVYGGASAVPSGATNADFANGQEGGVYTGLRFNRGVNVRGSGDTVYLVTPDGTVQDRHSYQDTYQGTSYNRSPDASASGTWVLHTTLSSSLTASPGRRVSGSAF